MFKSISIAAAFLVATPTISHAGPVTHQPAPAFVLQTYSGDQVALDDYRDRLVVLEWFAADCEFVADHYDDGEGHMPVLQAESIARGAVWLTINSSAHVVSAPQLRALAEELNMKSTDFLSDANGVVGKLYGARTTPHMVVIDRGTLVYQGAIDDRSSFFLPPAGSSSDGGERAFITDSYGERFDVTHAEQKYGMSRYGFEFGIGKNTIPPLDHPDMLKPGDPNYPSSWSRERIIGTKLGGETRSYPISPLSGQRSAVTRSSTRPLAIHKPQWLTDRWVIWLPCTAASWMDRL